MPRVHLAMHRLHLPISRCSLRVSVQVTQLMTIRESPETKRRDRPSQPRSRSTERTMTKTFLTIATALTMGIAAPAFAEGNAKASPWDSPNSLPPGFFDDTVQQMQVQIRDNWFASQAAQQHLANQPTKQVDPTSPQPHG
jgi:hypothetical protein